MQEVFEGVRKCTDRHPGLKHALLGKSAPKANPSSVQAAVRKGSEGDAYAGIANLSCRGNRSRAKCLRRPPPYCYSRFTSGQRVPRASPFFHEGCTSNL